MKAVAVVPGTSDGLQVLLDVGEPARGKEDALVRVVEAGICGTDVEICEGRYGAAPPGSPFLVLGHENLGVMESAPAGSGLLPGDLVVSTVRRPCPENCLGCASGENDMCLTGNYLERGIKRLHGFMAERYVERPAYLVSLPKHLRNMAVLTEPMSVAQKGIEQAFRIQQRLAWEPRTAVVLGAGPVGILAAASLRLRGLDVHVGALEPAGSSKDMLLRDAGIHYICTSSTPIESLPGRLGPIDLVFEATGAPSAVFPAMRILGPNGIAILSSVTANHAPIGVDLALWNREMVLGNRVVVGTVNAARRHFEAAVRDLETAEKRVPGWMRRLITRRLPFTEAAKALNRTPNDIKTVLEFE